MKTEKFTQKRVILVALGILAIVALYFLLNLFIIGEPVDGVQVYTSATANGQTLELHVSAIESAVALRDWQFQRDGSTLSISARKVLTSPLFPSGTYQTQIDMEGIAEIYLGGRLIWPDKGSV